jgi:hypothetical protein
MHLDRSTARCLVGIAALAACLSAEAGFDGKTFSAFYAFPNIGTAYGSASASPPSFVAGAGIETVFDVEGVTFVEVDFSDASLSLLLTTELGGPVWSATAFNGLVFDVTAGGPLSFTGSTVNAATTLAGFDASRVGLTGNRVTIDWNGLSYENGTRVVVDFTPSIPEPATYALMALGLASIAGTARVRRRRGG